MFKHIQFQTVLFFFATELITHILHPDPDQRYEISKIREHRWMAGPTLSDRRLKRKLLRRQKQVEVQQCCCKHTADCYIWQNI